MEINTAVQDESWDTPYYSFQTDDTHVETLHVAGGTVVVASRTAPHKLTSNEDCAAVLPLQNNCGVLVVADGLGGHASGELASRLAIEQIEQAIRERVDESQNPLEADQLRFAILNGIEKANQAVLDLGSGAGTTICVAEIQDSSIRVYHVGDSGILLIGQRGKLKLQTMAHSPIGYAVEAGLMNESDAMHHAERHLISNVIGSEEMRIEIGPARKMAKRDTLLLTTDGLLDNLHTEEIIERIRKGPLEAGFNRLLTDAWKRMEQRSSGDYPSKPDDLTIVTFRRNN